jgi:hypothetical protein
MLLIQDFQYTEDLDSNWVLLSSSTLSDERPKSTVPPLLDFNENNFAGSTFEDINKFLRTNEAKLKALDFATKNWVIVDQKGLDTETCLVVEQPYHFDGVQGKSYYLPDEFRATRVPLTYAWIMFVNLDISNMGFEEYVDAKAGIQEDGTWKWIGPFPSSNEVLERADREEDAKIIGRVYLLQTLSTIFIPGVFKVSTMRR